MTTVSTTVLFLGIGGSGMSSLAHMALDLGQTVIGYDKAESKVTELLKKRGAIIHPNLDAVPLTSIDLVVYSSAIHDKFPNLFETIRSKNIPVLHRSTYLHQIVSKKKSISIAGSHGKTSTTTMVSQILIESGMDPTVMIGGDTEVLGGKGGKGGLGDYAVYESDESDGSFLNHKAQIRILTNIDNDHLDHYKTRERLENAFLKYMAFDTQGHLVLYLDDSGITDVLNHNIGDIEYDANFHLWVVTDKTKFNHSQILNQLKEKLNSHLHCIFYTFEKESLVLKSEEGKEFLLQLTFPGVHYLTNGSLAVVASKIVGVEEKKSVNILREYKGVKRRQEKLGEWKGVTVIDDYGHHPTEIQMVIQSLKEKWQGVGRLIVLFQPHRYTRTQLLLSELAHSLGAADFVFLLPIYSAGEEPIPGISHDSFLTHMDSKNTSLLSGQILADVHSIKQILSSGDCFLCLGAGNVRSWGETLIGT
ncbi:UDP-N-acetylmuramate--L-alanine ligase [Leptospira sp. 96542]|nr:UDP-N-acetylmuramate--L-alanine ligase [Leptospira sp. 96542]